MPTYKTVHTDPEYGNYNVEAEFKITHSGTPSNNWDDPGSPPEIEIESIAQWADTAPDAVQVWEGKDIPTDLYEKLEAEIIEKFDFDDWYSDDCFDG